MPTVKYKSLHASPGQLVKIPNEFKKYIRGPGGDNLRNVSTLTGAEVSQLGDHELYVTGEKKKVEHAEYLLRTKVVSLTYELPLFSLLDNPLFRFNPLQDDELG